MRLLLLLSVSLLLAWQAARAQTADDFFNSGAHSYISNNIPDALKSVESGLKQYPDDVKLKKLYELLKQQQKSRSNQSRQNQKDQSQPQKSNSQQNQQQEQKQNEQNQSGQKNSEQNKRPQQQKSGEKRENQNKHGQPLKAGQMTPEEAKRLLNAQKGNEQFLQLKPPEKPQNNHQPIEDW
jgi:Ca-activated chloride channel homolog